MRQFWALIACIIISQQFVFSQTTQKIKYLDMPPELIAFDTDKGRTMLIQSKANESFWKLAPFFTTQPDLGSCGVASCVMILNALPIVRPSSQIYGTYNFFTPSNIFSPVVEKIKTKENVSKSGLTLDQLQAILLTFPVNASAKHANIEGLSSFRRDLIRCLQTSDEFIIVNYLRKAIGQQLGGHISPVGAYNEAADMVLILDVANFKYPWTWVKTEELWKAMLAIDDDSKLPRGYLLLSAK